MIAITDDVLGHLSFGDVEDTRENIKTMNVFYLDTHRCAKQHVDKHVVKMIVEYAQLLSTASCS